MQVGAEAGATARHWQPLLPLPSVEALILKLELVLGPGLKVRSLQKIR